MTIKNKLSEISKFEQLNYKIIELQGIVLETFESSNLCTVKVINQDSRPEILYKVPVKIYIPGIVGWFPKINEKVNVSNVNNVYEITAPYSYDIISSTSKNNITSNILSSFYGYTIGGNIF